MVAHEASKSTPGLLMGFHQVLQQMILYRDQLLPATVAAYLFSKLSTPRVAGKTGVVTV